MDAVDQLRLRKNWTHLIDSVNSEDVIHYLIQDFVFDFDMAEEIEAADTRKKRTRLLLTKLMRRGPAAYEAFRKALSQHEVYEHLVQRLDNTEIDPKILATRENDQPDLGITPVDDDTPSDPSPLQSSESFSSSSRSDPAEHPQEMLQPPSSSLSSSSSPSSSSSSPSSSSSSSVPPSSASSNFKIEGNHNFVIVGSSNTQVYYH